MLVHGNSDIHAVRDVEKRTIRAFVEKNQHRLTGRVLDFGSGLPHRCAQPQPYRSLVSGEYVPYDIGFPMPDGKFTAVLCTQVMQYVPDPVATLKWLRELTLYEEGVREQRDGVLVMTYPTHWPEVEHDDRWRFTCKGMEALLAEAGWTVREHDVRWRLSLPGYSMAGGYGVVAI